MQRGAAEELLSFKWHLRPKHESGDFANLVDIVQAAFLQMQKVHACPLFKAVPMLIVDAKWSLQCNLCNEWGSNVVWNSALQKGYRTGCISRPKKGNKFCEYHKCQCTLPHESQNIINHSDKPGASFDGMQLRYQMADNTWKDASQCSIEDIRAYEMSLLPLWHVASNKIIDSTYTCGTNVRNSIEETRVPRKSGGILVGVTPCLQILLVRPLYGSESCTQVVEFVWLIVGVLHQIAFIAYDNACGLVRFIMSQSGQRAGEAKAAWAVLEQLSWVIDKLHFCYHKACRTRLSRYFLPRANPYHCTKLHGIDTEAAEQVFSLASRWTTVLNDMGPEHFALFLLIFANFHNDTHSCDEACRVYFAAQRQGQRVTGSDFEYSGDEVDGPVCEGPKKRRRQKGVRFAGNACADHENSEQDKHGGGVNSEMSHCNRLQGSLSVFRRIHPDDDVICNFSSSTIHCVQFGSRTSACGWHFGSAQTCSAKSLIGDKSRVWFTCGASACCGRKVEFHDALMPE